MELSGFNTFIEGSQTDLMDIFQPLTTTNTSNTGFKSRNNQNKDLSEMFEPYISGTKAAVTKYKVFSTGNDLCDTFKPAEFFPTKTAQLYSQSDSLFWMTIYNNWALAVRASGGGPGTTIYYSNNNGLNWSAYTNASWTSTLQWKGIAAYSTNAIACTTDNVWVTSDYGASWVNRTPSSTNPLYLGVAIYDTKLIVTDASNSKVFSSPNLGITWYTQTDTDITFPRNVSITKNGANYPVVVCCTSSNLGTIANKLLYHVNYDFNSNANNFTVSSLFVFPITVSLDGRNGISGAYQGATPTSVGYSRIKYTTDAGATWTDSKYAIDNTNISDNVYVCSLSGNIGIAITYASKYLVSIDGGKTWSNYTTPSNNLTFSCANHNKKIVMSEASAQGVFVYYGLYYGMPFTNFPTISTQPSTSTNAQASAMYKNIVLVAHRSGGSMRLSTDGGKNFVAVTSTNTNFTSANWRGIAIDKTQAIAVSTTNVFTSNDSGSTWTECSITSTNFTGCAVYDGVMIVADQANSKLYFSIDVGSFWLSQSVNYPRGCAVTRDASLNCVVVYSEMNSASGTTPQAFKVCSIFNPSVTTNTFVNCTYKGTAPIAIALDGRYGVCVSYTGTLPAIKYSSDYGKSWLLSDVTVTSNMTWASVSGRFSIVSAGGLASYYVSNDYGQTWTTVLSPNSYIVDVASNYLNNFTLFIMNPGNSNCYYGIAEYLRPAIANVSGFTTASAALTSTSTSIQNAAMYQNVVIAIASSGGAMRRSTDNGATFSTITITGYPTEVWKYVAMDQTEAIAISQDNIFTSNDSGTSWTARTTITSTNFTGAAIYNGLMMVADQANSRLCYSTNNGVTWVTQSSISCPRGCAITMDGSLNYVVLITNMTNSTSAVSNGCIICKNFNPASTSNTFVSTIFTAPTPFLVALDGKYAICSCLGAGTGKSIKYSTDYGENWTNIAENITASCYAVSMSNGYAMVFPTTGTDYYISNNYGQTWQIKTSPSNDITTGANFSNRGAFFISTGAYTNAFNGTIM